MNGTVLEEEIDENYEPTPQEVEEYARYIGLDPAKDASLLWIAREGLKAPLPEEWKPCRSAEGDLYYFNFVTGKSSWSHPCDEYYRSLCWEEKRRAADGPAASAIPQQQQLLLFARPAAAGQPHFGAGSMQLGTGGGAPAPRGTESYRSLSAPHGSWPAAGPLGSRSTTAPMQPAGLGASHPQPPLCRQQQLGGGTGGSGVQGSAGPAARRVLDSQLRSSTPGEAGRHHPQPAPALHKPPTTAPGTATAASPTKKVTWQDLVSTDPQPTAQLPAAPAAPSLVQGYSASSNSRLAAGGTAAAGPAQSAAQVRSGSTYAQQMQLYRDRMAAAAAAEAAMATEAAAVEAAAEAAGEEWVSAKAGPFCGTHKDGELAGGVSAADSPVPAAEGSSGRCAADPSTAPPGQQPEEEGEQIWEQADGKQMGEAVLRQEKPNIAGAAPEAAPASPEFGLTESSREGSLSEPELSESPRRRGAVQCKVRVPALQLNGTSRQAQDGCGPELGPKASMGNVAGQKRQTVGSPRSGAPGAATPGASAVLTATWSMVGSSPSASPRCIRAVRVAKLQGASSVSSSSSTGAPHGGAQIGHAAAQPSCLSPRAQGSDSSSAAAAGSQDGSSQASVVPATRGDPSGMAGVSSAEKSVPPGGRDQGVAALNAPSPSPSSGIDAGKATSGCQQSSQQLQQQPSNVPAASSQTLNEPVPSLAGSQHTAVPQQAGLAVSEEKHSPGSALVAHAQQQPNKPSNAVLEVPAQLAVEAASLAAQACTEHMKARARQQAEEEAEARHRLQLKLDGRHLAAMDACVRGMRESLREINNLASVRLELVQAAGLQAASSPPDWLAAALAACKVRGGSGSSSSSGCNSASPACLHPADELDERMGKCLGKLQQALVEFVEE